MSQSKYYFQRAISHTLAKSWFGLMLLLLCPGCLVPATRMESCQARYHQLSEKNKSLQTEVANLEAACRKLQTERDQSEQELVFLDKEVPLLFAKERQLTQPPPATGSELTALAADIPGLDFDATSGALLLKSDTFFRPGTELKAVSGEPLGTLATILNQPSLQGHRVLIVTTESSESDRRTNQKSLQRALALQEFFCGWGIEKNRLGVSNYGHISGDSGARTADHGPTAAETGKMRIFLLKEDIPVIGWDTPKSTRYR